MVPKKTSVIDVGAFGCEFFAMKWIHMAQEPCIGLYKPCINLPFGDCAMYFDHKVYDCWLSGKTRAKTHIYSKKTWSISKGTDRSSKHYFSGDMLVFGGVSLFLEKH